MFRWIAVTIVGLLLYAWVVQQDFSELITDNGKVLRETLIGLGWRGPFTVILLMTVAVVLSPLPSAPIAIAAGAIYGHGWGTLYVLLGAEVGAIVAFLIARYLRPESLALWLDKHFTFGKFDSQYSLMIAVCASRLMPFISFDLISYAAGLTQLRMWRFAIATIFGILPASFVLAHIGGELSTFDGARIGLSLLLLGFLGLAPFIYQIIKSRSSNRR